MSKSPDLVDLTGDTSSDDEVSQPSSPQYSMETPADTVDASGQAEPSEASGEPEMPEASGEPEMSEASGEPEMSEASGEPEMPEASGEPEPPEQAEATGQTDETVRLVDIQNPAYQEFEDRPGRVVKRKLNGECTVELVPEEDGVLYVVRVMDKNLERAMISPNQYLHTDIVMVNLTNDETPDDKAYRQEQNAKTARKRRRRRVASQKAERQTARSRMRIPKNEGNKESETAAMMTDFIKADEDYNSAVESNATRSKKMRSAKEADDAENELVNRRGTYHVNKNQLNHKASAAKSGEAIRLDPFKLKENPLIMGDDPDDVMPEGSHYDRRDYYSTLNTKALKQLTRERNLLGTGAKSALIGRLSAADDAAIREDEASEGEPELHESLHAWSAPTPMVHAQPHVDGTYDSYNALTVVQLRDMLRARGSRMGGNKHELIGRLMGKKGGKRTFKTYVSNMVNGHGQIHQTKRFAANQTKNVLRTRRLSRARSHTRHTQR